MVKTKKFAKYGYDTKTTTIRIPDLNDLDKEKSLRKMIDGFVIEQLFTSNSKTNTIINKLRFLYNLMSEKTEFKENIEMTDNEITELQEIREVIK
ncbi:hypothetical protein ES703_11025 [subsurface metagenome]